jgi:UPF0042 nucleotide-binding protein
MKSKEVLEVVLFSFGFKYGAPVDVNMIWDVRFLPNPYWVEELRPETGRVDKVAAYVLESDEGRGFLSLLKPMTTFLIEQNSAAEKKSLHIGIGCTGGRHRSVAVTEALADFLDRLSIEHTIYHRDIGRDGSDK